MRRYTWIVGRKSSNYCSTIIIVVVVSACLIGTCITVSSLADSTRNFSISVGLTKDVKPHKVSKVDSKDIQYNLGDLPEDGLKGNVNQARGKDESDSKPQRNEKTIQEFEKFGELDKKEKLENASSDDDERIASTMRIVEPRKDEGAKHIEDNSVSSTEGDETTSRNQQESEENMDASKIETDEGEEKSWVKGSDGTKEKIDEVKDEGNTQGLGQAVVRPDEGKEARKRIAESGSKDQSELLDKTFTQTGVWLTQAAESDKQKVSEKSSLSKDQKTYRWKLCNVTAGPDYIPCLDNIQAIRKLPSTSHYEHRERHCPDEAPTCLVPLPVGYRTSVKWPKSRERIWFGNVPHTKLVEFKGHQNWVQVSGSYITFPGGGTQFKHGAMHYIDFIQKTVPDIAWGKKSRVILDVGCGVASFGGYLFDREVLTMSLAPEDKHEAQVQFALERGIPAVSAIMGTKRLPFPTMAFDVVHCARCRVPWHVEGGKLLLELDRVLQPGGYFVWSATPVYRKEPEDVSIWKGIYHCWLEKPPYWLKESEAGVYGKAAPKDFIDDYNHWKHVFAKSYYDGLGIDWSSVRNVMDMRAVYGGFAAALKDLKLWVMNVVPVTSSNTLPIIYERGLFGIYHDWCESFSTYPKSYDLLHADNLFSDLKKRCKFVAVMAEVDRILRSEGTLVVRDDAEIIAEVENMAKSLQWKVRFTFSKDNEGLLCVQKTRWRPPDVESITSAIA